jgi:endoglucanase
MPKVIRVALFAVLLIGSLPLHQAAAQQATSQGTPVACAGFRMGSALSITCVDQAATPTLTPTPSSTPVPSPTPTIVTPQASRAFGVNLSGGEFGTRVPGTMNQDYIYPSDRNEDGYYVRNGLSLIRLPIRWERIQHSPFAFLETADIAAIHQSIAAASASNAKVIIELHNYARYNDQPMTTASAPAFSDVWRKLATEFHKDPGLYGYELMNEPHDLSEFAGGWSVLAQNATNAIREVDSTSLILVPGYQWQGTQDWAQNNPDLNVTDPASHMAYAGHTYFDADASGSYSNGYDASSPTIGVERLASFRSWLAAHNATGMLTEYGVPGNDPRWLTVLDNYLAAAVSDPHIVGGTAWSGGPWWGNYPLSLEPQFGTDAPQLAVLKKYPSR